MSQKMGHPLPLGHSTGARLLVPVLRYTFWLLEISRGAGPCPGPQVGTPIFGLFMHRGFPPAHPQNSWNLHWVRILSSQLA